MNTIALPKIKSMSKRYPATEERLQKQEKSLSRTEKILGDIAFYKQYVEDLRAGRPVDNIHPDNDSYYLVPENVEDIINDLEYQLQGGTYIRVDPNNIWACIK